MRPVGGTGLRPVSADAPDDAVNADPNARATILTMDPAPTTPRPERVIDPRNIEVIDEDTVRMLRAMGGKKRVAALNDLHEFARSMQRAKDRSRPSAHASPSRQHELS